MAMSCIFQTSTHLAASPQVMFRFHSDPNNLMKVMPPTLTLVSLQTDGPAEEGRLIELHCRDWGLLPLRLTCRWNVVQPPHRLAQVSLSPHKFGFFEVKTRVFSRFLGNRFL
jgi:hypothetical protein